MKGSIYWLAQLNKHTGWILQIRWKIQRLMCDIIIYVNGIGSPMTSFQEEIEAGSQTSNNAYTTMASQREDDSPYVTMEMAGPELDKQSEEHNIGNADEDEEKNKLRRQLSLMRC